MKVKLPLILTITILIVAIINGGCSKKEYSKEEVYEGFQKQISKINGYTCKSNVVAVGNKNDTIYIFKETYDKSKLYRIEVELPKELKGKVIEYKPNTIKIMNKVINDTVEFSNTENNNKKYFFIGNFIDNYNESKLLNLSMEQEKLKMEIDIPNNDKYFDKQILYINAKTKTPEKMQIIDCNKNVIFSITYDNFKYN